MNETDGQRNTSLYDKSELRRERNRLSQQKRRRRLRETNINSSNTTEPVSAIPSADSGIDRSPFSPFDFTLDIQQDFDPNSSLGDIDSAILEQTLREIQPGAPRPVSTLLQSPPTPTPSITATHDQRDANAVARKPYCRFTDGLAPSGRTALHLISESGTASSVRYILRSTHISILARDAYDFTALHLATRAGKLDIVQTLLDADRERISITRNGEGILGSTDSMLNSSLNATTTTTTTAEKMERLIDIKDCLGWTALHHAAWCGNEKMVALLIENGAAAEEAIDGRDITMLPPEIRREVYTSCVVDK